MFNVSTKIVFLLTAWIYVGYFTPFWLTMEDGLQVWVEWTLDMTGILIFLLNVINRINILDQLVHVSLYNFNGGINENHPGPCV